MAVFKYFADKDNGETIEFSGNIDYKNGGFYGYDRSTKQWVKCNRRIKMKSYPRKHECDTRCATAKGRNMSCECACGGKNHGKYA